MKCLEKNPARRFRGARDLADAIRLAARPKGLKTQIFAGIKGLLRPTEPMPEPKAGEKQQHITKEARQEAARLASEASLAYFTDFSVEQAHNLVFAALKLDPFSADACAMLIVLAPHMGETSALRKAGARMRQVAKAGPGDASSLYAGLLAEYLGGAKDWLKKMEYYLGGDAADPALLAICARARMGSGDYGKAREYAGRISRVIPGGSLFPWFVDAYTNAGLGRRAQWQESTAEAIKDHPGNSMLRFALIEGLIETGKLDEAEKALDEAADLARNSEFLLIFRAELAIMRKEYKTACVELRKAIGGGGQEDIIAREYYRLNKIYALRGDRKEALRHLGIGRNLAPEMNFKSNEELAALVEGSVDYRPAFENLPTECLELNFRMGRKALLDNLFSGCKNHCVPFSTVYIFDKEAVPRAVRAWLFFNELRQNAPKQRKLFLPALPLSSFVDAHGSLLKTEFNRTQADYSRYQAAVTFAAPLTQFSPGSAEAQLNIEGLWKERQGGVLDLRLDETCHMPGHRCHILALPEDSEMIELSARADKELKRGGWRFLVYSRFAFDCEHFRLNAKFRHKRP